MKRLAKIDRVVKAVLACLLRTYLMLGGVSIIADEVMLTIEYAGVVVAIAAVVILYSEIRLAAERIHRIVKDR